MFSRDIFDPQLEELARLRISLRPSQTATFEEEVYDEANKVSRRISRAASDPHGRKRRNGSTQQPPRLESKDTGDLALRSSEALPEKKVPVVMDAGALRWCGSVLATAEDGG